MRFRQQRVITNLDAEKNFIQAETEFDSIASEQAAQQAEIDALQVAPPAHAASHLPGGSDALTTATAGTIQPDDTAAEGSATSFARSDHRHSITAATAGTILPDDTAAEGSATSFSRSDHRHAIAAAAASTISGTNAEGSSTSFARADHDHAVNLEGTQKDCGAGMTVGASVADVNNLTYTVGATGTYLVTFNLDVNCTTSGGVFIGSINVNGSDVRSAVFSASATNNRTTVSLTRRVAVTAGQVVKITAVRIAGGGYTIEAANSSMTVQRVA